MALVITLVAFVAQQPQAAAVTIPHLTIPFLLDRSGAANVLQQDTLPEITQCVTQLLGTVIGSREVLPIYGIQDPTFIGVDPTAIVNAVAAWEPRAAVTIAVSNPPSVPAVVTVTVEQATP
jgi:phage baseplate assembly protein W